MSTINNLIEIFSSDYQSDSYEKQIELAKQYIDQRPDPGEKTVTLVSGAGPSGLFRTIFLILNKYPVHVIEKRSLNTSGRDQTVAIDQSNFSLLKATGVLQYLRKEGLIFPNQKKLNNHQYFAVRLKDLESAMKAVIHDLSPDTAIQYDSRITKISEDGIYIEKNGGDTQILKNISIIVNTEGARGTTNKMLKIGRQIVTPKRPLLVALFKDQRAPVDSPSSFYSYLTKTAAYACQSLFDYGQYFGRTLLGCIRRKDAPVKASLLLKTPGQNSLGIILSRGAQDELTRLQQQVDKLKSSPDSTENELNLAARALKNRMEYWSRMAFCQHNLEAYAAYCLRLKLNVAMETGAWLPFDQAQIVMAGADRSTAAFKRISEKTTLVNAGDALATVHPASGEGCNSALITAPFISPLATSFAKRKITKSDALLYYQINHNRTVKAIHNASQRITYAIYGGLSQQEIIFNLRNEGWGIKRIARELGISPNTVKKRLQAKL